MSQFIMKFVMLFLKKKNQPQNIHTIRNHTFNTMVTLWIRHYERLHFVNFKMLGEFGLGLLLLQLTSFMKAQWPSDFVLKYKSMSFLDFCLWHFRFFNFAVKF